MSEPEKRSAVEMEIVEILVDGRQHKIKAGLYKVADFKTLVGVEADKEMEQVVDGKLIPLADDATITIKKNGERFVSHIRRGGSS